MTERKNRPMYHFIKRIFDVLISGIAIMLLALPMVLIAAAVWLDDPGPVLFRQKRVGRKRNGQLTYFRIVKFRTMRISAPHDVPTHLLEDPQRHITRVGAFLRRSSLDELPQLFQVFTGKLSLVGPRPALWTQADLILERERVGANALRPGITGWAQIHGRDTIPLREKVRLDGEYAEALRAGGFRAFAMDLQCLLGTVGCVCKGDGYAEGKVTSGKNK